MGAVLLINASGVETRVALVEDGTISEYYLERNKDKGIVGNIYKGKVVRVLPGMQAAFVDIGLDKAAFLYVNDVFYDPDFSEQQFELTEGEHAEYEEDEVICGAAGSHCSHCDQEDCEHCSHAESNDDSDEDNLTIAAPKLFGARSDEAGEATPVDEAEEEERRGELRSRGGRRRRNRSAKHEMRRPDADMAAEAPETNHGFSGEAPQTESQESAGNAGTVSADSSDPGNACEAAACPAENAAEVPENTSAEAASQSQESVQPTEDAAVDVEAPASAAADDAAPTVSSSQADRDATASDEAVSGEDSAEDGADKKTAGESTGADVSEATVSENSAAAECGLSDHQSKTEDSADADSEETPADSEAAPQSEDSGKSDASAEVTPSEITPSDTSLENDAFIEAAAAAEGKTSINADGQFPRERRQHHKPDRGGKKGGRDRGDDRGDSGSKGQQPQKRHATANIQDILKVGQEIIVQVAKDPIGTKGARVTSHISIPGRQIVFMPTVDHVGISRRIEKESERRRLREIVERIRPAGTGFIVRTVAENISTEKLEADARFLTGIWNEVVSKKDKVSAPALLHPDLDLTLRATRDLFVQDVEKLVIDDRAEWERISRFVAAQAPSLKDRVVLHDSDEPIFEAYGIEDELKRAYSRKVWLKSGGYLIIDQAEALTAIDVNSGRYVGKKSLEETITKINIEAAKEIVYQLRLRNIGGIMIIDFIDMAKAQNRDKVFKALQEALGKDKARTNILKISELGLIEMTRKRVRESVGRTLNEPCPYCDGRGFLKSRETVAYEIFRQIRSTAYLYTDCSINVNCHPDVARILTVDERDELRYLMNRFNKAIHVHPQPGYHQEQVEIYGKQERSGRGRGDKRNGGQLKAPDSSGELKPASASLETPQGRLSEYGTDGKLSSSKH